MKSLDIKPRAKKRPGIPRRLPSPAPAVPVTAPAQPRRMWPRAAAGTLALVAVLLAVFAFLILPEVRIDIAARSEPVTRDFDIKIDTKQEKANFAELVAPGEVVAQEISGTKTFASSGARDIGRTASGFVSIYNFSKTTLILKSQTTVLSANGKKYHFTQDVGNIRPTALIGLEDQEVDESSLIAPVPVAADAPGETYNLPKGTRLEMENEVFGNQPKALYAVVAEDIAGGTSEQVKIVTEGDVAAAYDTLKKELLESSRKALTAQSPNTTLLDSAVSSEVIEEKTSLPVGTEKAEFDATVRLKLRALVYEEDDIKNIILERIRRLLPENKVLEGAGSGRLQSKFLSVDLDNGFGILQNHYENEIVYQVDKAELLEKVKGKREAEIRDILLSRPEIAGISVKFYPFWAKKAPKFSKKIFIRLTRTAE